MIKKICAFTLAMAMVFAQAAPSFAEDFNDGNEIVLNDETSEVPAEEKAENSSDLAEVKEDTSEDAEFTDESIEEETPEIEASEAEDDAEEILMDEGSSEEIELFMDDAEEYPIQTYAAGNSTSTATRIAIGNTYSGSITNSNTADYYRITIPSSGRVRLTAKAKMEDISYKIYNSTENEVWVTYQTWNSTTGQISTDSSVDLTKGTYYFIVQQRYGETGNYSFKLEFTGANESFAETGNGSNNSLAKASKINVNTEYKGQIAVNDDKDYYKFTLASSGRIGLSATAIMEDISYKIYDSMGNELWATYPTWNSTTEQISTDRYVDLTKGTYYFIVQKRYGATGNYSFKLAFTSANESFTETENGSNNTLSSANAITLNKTYRGQIADNDEKDFYRFTLNASTRIRVSAVAGMEYIEYRIYDSRGNEQWDRVTYWNSVTEKSEISEDINLPAGTYYFVAQRKYGCTGNYVFKIGTHVHSYKNSVTKATLSRNGKITGKCSCGAVKYTTVYYPRTITLSAASYTYDGKAKTPSVTVKGSDGKVISPSNYTVSYAKDRKNVGTYKVSIKFKGNYSGTASRTFRIYPKGTSITKLTAKSKGFKVNWKKQSSQTTGYQIQYSVNKNFSGKTTKTITKNSTTSATYKSLKAKKGYYVRIRTYKKVGGTTYYSAWSQVKTVKTKK